MRIAAVTAWRTTGSPERIAKRRSAAPQIARGLGAQQPPGQHQCPSRGVDKDRIGMAEMARPIGLAELVADQLVDGLGVGNAQQGFGEAE